MDWVFPPRGISTPPLLAVCRGLIVNIITLLALSVNLIPLEIICELLPAAVFHPSRGSPDPGREAPLSPPWRHGPKNPA